MPFSNAVPASFPIFLNPHAGRGANAEQEALRSAFQEVRVEPDIRIVVPAQIEAALRAATTNGGVIGVAGGDGTISSAANALSGSAATLLPIPLGTLNHFCKRYRIDSVAAAVQAYRSGNAVTVPVGVVNQRVFINNASCGFYPHLVRHRERIERLLPRLPAMWLAGLRVLLELPMLHVEIDIHGGRRQLRTPALWVGIGRNSLRLPEHDEPDVNGANLLEIVAGRAETRRDLLRLGVRLLRHLRQGLEPRAPGLVVEHAAHFVLQARHAVDIALDGEPIRMRTPLTFAFRDNALRLLCLVGTPGHGYFGPR